MNPGEPSRTAMVVAKSQALVGMSPATARLVHPDTLRFVQAALRHTGHDRFVDLLRHATIRQCIRFYESCMVPGLALHHALRKQTVARIVQRELRAGATRVIQLGAGFDALAHRLHPTFTRASFVELDHPATQEPKRRIIASLGGANGNLVLRPVDLAAAIDPQGLPDSSERTVIIIEGVLMYLDPDRVRQILRLIRDRMHPSSLLLFSFMESPRFQRQSPAVTWWLRAGGEPFRWSQRREGLASALAPLGLAPQAIHATQSQTDRTTAEGELLCEARPRPLGEPTPRHETVESPRIPVSTGTG